jgi:hypothetical protein
MQEAQNIRILRIRNRNTDLNKHYFFSTRLNLNPFCSGYFTSPMADILPEVCPPECARAHFQAVLPEVWPGPGRPVVLQLAGTGDHFFWRRRTLMAKPLVKERGVGSILLGT